MSSTVDSLWADEDLEGTPRIHLPVSLRCLVESNFAVEDAAWANAAGEDAGHQGLDICAGGCGSAGEGDVAAEEAPESDWGVLILRDANAADDAARAYDADG